MPTSSVKIICGLGNPESVAPTDSLHNVGFMTLDNLALNHGTLPSWEEIDDALVLSVEQDGRDLHLVKPMCVDINSSGVPVERLLRRFGCSPAELAVVHDDIDLQQGQIKIKHGPSNDRHFGVRSISEQLSSQDYIRLKGGVGRPKDKTASIVAWVKEKMSPESKPGVEKLVAKLAETVRILCSSGIDEARAFLKR